MTVTDKLLKVFQIDQQITGLESRLRAAERFLGEQTKQLSSIETKKAAAERQLKQLAATVADAEGEMARLDERIAELRSRMDESKTNKEYKALLSEVNTLKEQRSEHETKAIEMMEESDALKAQLEELASQTSERERVKTVAAGDRDKRAEEIKDKLDALRAERETLASDVPPAAMGVYSELTTRIDEEPMAPIEIADRRRHEYHCGSCMMSLPMETMSALLSHGQLTQCVSCQVILYLDEKARERMLAKK